MSASRAVRLSRCLEHARIPPRTASAALEAHDGHRRGRWGWLGCWRAAGRRLSTKGTSSAALSGPDPGSPDEAPDPTPDSPTDGRGNSPRETKIRPPTSYTSSSYTPSSPTSRWNLPPHKRPTHSTDKSLDLTAQLRVVFQHFPQPVVICTSTAPSTTPPPSTSPSTHKANPDMDPETTPHSMTLSSLTPLSMNPTPVISLNIMMPSRTLDAIRASGRFAVHILAPTKASAGIARWFARAHPPSDDPSRSIFHKVREFVRGTGAVVAPTATEGPLAKPGDRTAPPILGGSAVLFAFVCRLPEDVPGQGIVQVRDHAIVVGQVEEVVPGHSTDLPTDFGMVYSRRRFWRLRNEVF